MPADCSHRLLAEGLMDSAAARAQVRCQAPAKLALQQLPQLTIRLQAAQPGKAAGTEAAQVFRRSTTRAACILHLPWLLPDDCVLYIWVPILKSMRVRQVLKPMQGKYSFAVSSWPAISGILSWL